MSRGASFSKEMRERAKAEDKALICLDITNKSGRWRFWNAIDHDLSGRIWWFVHLIQTGTKPREAFDKVWPGEAKS